MSVPIEFVEDLRVRKICSTIGHTILVFDYFLTLQDEIRYIWKSPWTIVKVMFLLNRYGNLIGQTFIQLEEAGLIAHNSESFCGNFIIISTIYMILSEESIHILVLMRARAIWGTGKRTSQILICGYLTYITVRLVGALWALNIHAIQIWYLNYGKVCVSHLPNRVWLSYVGSVVLDSLLFALTMRSLQRYYREFRYLYPSGLLRVLIRDAVLFFVVGMTSDILTIASWIVYMKSPKYFISKGFANPLLSVAGQRLVLNLRGLKAQTYASHDLSREVDRQLQEFADPDFEIGPDDIRDPECAWEASESNANQD